MDLVIACNRPGLIRGGIRHPQAAVHDLGAFSPSQLRDMLAEPELTLVVGTRLTLADVTDAEGGAPGAFHAALDAAALRLARGVLSHERLAYAVDGRLLDGPIVVEGAGVHRDTQASLIDTEGTRRPIGAFDNLHPGAAPLDAGAPSVQGAVNAIAQHDGEIKQVDRLDAPAVAVDTTVGHEAVARETPAIETPAIETPAIETPARGRGRR